MVGVPGRGHDGSVRAVREQRNAELAGRIRREDEVRAVVVRQGDAGPGDRLARVHRAVAVQVPVDRPTDRLRCRRERDVELVVAGNGARAKDAPGWVNAWTSYVPAGRDGEEAPTEPGWRPTLPGPV